MENEINNRYETADIQSKDSLDNAKRIFGYFDEHPEVGLMGCGAVTAAGIIGMAVYGLKMCRI